MSRFLAIVNASDPDLLASIESASGRVVIANDGGVLVIDGDADAAQAVEQLAAIRAVGPVDASWDTSTLGLDDNAQAFVDAWNGGYDEDYLAAAEQGYRRGEAWNFPDGCFQTGVETADGLVASALPETYGGDDGDSAQVAQNDPTDPAGPTDDSPTDGDTPTDGENATDADAPTVADNPTADNPTDADNPTADSPADGDDSTDGGLVADNAPSDQTDADSTDPDATDPTDSATDAATDGDADNDNPDGTVA